MSCLTSMTLAISSSDFKVCTVAFAAFLSLFLIRTAQRTRSLALVPKMALAVQTPPPVCAQTDPDASTVLHAGHPCGQGPTLLGCEGWHRDIKATGIPEDT